MSHLAFPLVRLSGAFGLARSGLADFHSKPGAPSHVESSVRSDYKPDPLRLIFAPSTKRCYYAFFLHLEELFAAQ
jgi:hypothetical protein